MKDSRREQHKPVQFPPTVTCTSEGSIMFASIRAYRFQSGSMDGLMHRVDRDFADALSREPGFVGHQAVATGHDTLVSISLFGSREDAERTTALAAEWVVDDLADFGIQPTDTMTGEVMVSRAAPALLEPTHR